MRVERRQAHPVLSKIDHTTPILLVPGVYMVTGIYPKSNLFWTEDTDRFVSSTSIERTHSHCGTPHIADANAHGRLPETLIRPCTLNFASIFAKIASSKVSALSPYIYEVSGPHSSNRPTFISPQAPSGRFWVLLSDAPSGPLLTTDLRSTV